MNAAEDHRALSAAALDDPRVGAALREYLDALETGAPPDRAAFLARHANIAAALAECLEGLDFVHTAARSAPPDRAAPVDGLANPAVPLGDFRIVREIGRGGMGVVYEAEQMSLGRRVALKVLPFAATLDSRQLQRFKNEAQAAAQLHHPNIVAVYYVGCERGVHFYAMQYIDGRTLAEVITELCGEHETASKRAAGASDATVDAASARVAPNRERETINQLAGLSTQRSIHGPTHFQMIARLGVQAAEALEHAHQLGIVHRDIKPANLLIDHARFPTPDSLHLWVTDFGLAQVQSNAGLTITGDLVGTLRYMSPEQALAQRDAIDHRTDIYSLGATLYELLTLQPAFPGSDRQELLRQIAFEEPLPPRRVNPAVPAELETIVLKATEKHPAERYASAKDLADDLGRYLRDEPIRATRPTLWQRLRKWFRRHKAVTASVAISGVVLLVLAVIGLALSNRFIADERSQKDAALQEAIASLRAADENFQRACDAVDRMLTRVAEERLRFEPGMVQMRRRLLEDARDFYLSFLRQRGHDARVRHEAGRAYLRLGSIQRLLGQPAESEAAYRQASALLEELAAEFPHEADFQLELADSCLGTASALGLAERRPEEEQACRKAQAIIEALLAESPNQPTYQKKWIDGQIHLAWSVVLTGRHEQAEQIARDALRRADQLATAFPAKSEYGVARPHCQRILALALRLTGQLAEAEQHQRRALHFFREQASGQENANPEARHMLAASLNELGEILLAAGKSLEAEQRLQEALRIEQPLAEAFPGVHDYGMILQGSSCQLISLLIAAGRAREAEQNYRRMAELYERMAAEFPALPDYQRLAASNQKGLGQLLLGLGRIPEGEGPLHKALELYERLVARFPASPRFGLELLETRIALRPAILESGRWEEAEKDFRATLTLAAKRAADFPADHRFRHVLAQSNDCLGLVLGEIRRPAEAERVFRQAIAIWSDLTAKYPMQKEYQFWLATCQNDLADVFSTCPEKEYWDPDKAVRLAKNAVKLQPEDGNFWNTLGTARYRAGDYVAALKELEKARQMHKGGDCYDWFFLSMTHWQLGHKEEAQKFYHQAVVWMEDNKAKLQTTQFQAARFRRFRAEAEELLEIQNKPKPES